MLRFEYLQYPFLFDVPILRRAARLRGLFVRGPRNWPAGMPIMGQFLSLDPPIFCCQPRPWPFGAAHYLAGRFPEQPLIFLTPITMSLERFTFAVSLAAQHRRFCKAHPRAPHRLGQYTGGRATVAAAGGGRSICSAEHVRGRGDVPTHPGTRAEVRRHLQRPARSDEATRAGTPCTKLRLRDEDV